MALKKSQRSLRAWTKQKWGTKSGKKSSETGERYLPKAARDALSPAEYAATSRKKREDTKKGKQHSKQPKKIARKVRKYRRVGKQEGGVTQAPPEFLQEIGEYSQAIPINLLDDYEKALKLDRQIASLFLPANKLKTLKKSSDKVYYHLTTSKNADKIKKEGFNPLAPTNFVRGDGRRYQKDMGLFLFTNPIAALKFAKQRFWSELGDKEQNLKIIPVKLKSGTKVTRDKSGDPALGSNAMNKLNLDKFAKKEYPTHSFFISANDTKNKVNFLNKDVVLGKGKTVGQLIKNPKNPNKDINWYPKIDNLDKIQVNNDPTGRLKFITKKDITDYLKEIDLQLINK